jgi:hypothetical protein
VFPFLVFGYLIAFSAIDLTDFNKSIGSTLQYPILVSGLEILSIDFSAERSSFTERESLAVPASALVVLLCINGA